MRSFTRRLNFGADKNLNAPKPDGQTHWLGISQMYDANTVAKIYWAIPRSRCLVSRTYLGPNVPLSAAIARLERIGRGSGRNQKRSREYREERELPTTSSNTRTADE